MRTTLSIILLALGLATCIGCEPTRDNTLTAADDASSTDDWEVQVTELKIELDETKLELDSAQADNLRLAEELDDAVVANSKLKEKIGSLSQKFKTSESKLKFLMDDIYSIGSDISSLLPNNESTEAADSPPANASNEPETAKDSPQDER